MEYSITSQPIALLNDLHQTGRLELSGGFKSKEERSELVSMICDNLPIPEVFMQALIEPETGREKYVVVLGQENVRSILAFISGDILLPNGTRFQDLSPESKHRFWSYNVAVRILRNTTHTELDHLFRRAVWS